MRRLIGDLSRYPAGQRSLDAKRGKQWFIEIPFDKFAAQNSTVSPFFTTR
jgi:hypothetical protein